MANDNRQSNRMPANEMQRFLAGARYPARKEDLINTAKDNGADERVIDALQSMPGDEFSGPQDVMRAYGNE